jgi:hypothetical protein
MVGSMRGCAYFRRKLAIPIEPKGGPGAILESRVQALGAMRAHGVY